MKLKILIQRPFLELKWALTRRKRVKQAELGLRDAKAILDARDALYKRFLEADRKEDKTTAAEMRAKMEALDYVVGKKDSL